MIEWIKKADGTWAFDYKIFDEYVELAMECGIDEAITLYTPIPWGFRHRYKDEATGDYSYQLGAKLRGIQEDVEYLPHGFQVPPGS